MRRSLFAAGQEAAAGNAEIRLTLLENDGIFDFETQGFPHLRPFFLEGRYADFNRLDIPWPDVLKQSLKSSPVLAQSSWTSIYKYSIL